MAKLVRSGQKYEYDDKKLEQYQNFAVTVTLKPEYQSGSVNVQLVWGYSEIQRLIKKYIRFHEDHVNYDFYPEFTDNLGLHFHGVLYMAQTASVIRRRHLFTNNLGYSLFKPCKDIIVWLKYMSKNEQLTQQVFPSIHFPLLPNNELKIDDERYLFDDKE